MRRAALLTFVIIGAGPTGVELAGTIAELAQRHLATGFPQHRHPQGAGRPDRGRIARAGRLSRRAVGLCATLAGKSRRRSRVRTAGHRMHRRRRRLWRQETGSQDHHLGRRRARIARGRMAGRAGRPRRPPAGAPDLTVPGHPEVFAVGDTVTINGPDARPVPGIAPAAKQQGRYVANAIKARLRGEKLAPFVYKHAGNLAQIGKRLAVIDFGRVKTARRTGMVDLGHRPHLLPDRPAQPAGRRHQLAVDLHPQPARRAPDHARPRQGEQLLAVAQTVMPGALRGQSTSLHLREEDVDGRDKPGHDGERAAISPAHSRRPQSAGRPARRGWSTPACSSHMDISTPPAS